jgi:hypothetical protein
MLDHSYILQVKVRNNYGTDTVYPDCEVSRFFCNLTRTKILTPSMVETIKKGGYTLNVAATKI